MARVRRFLSAAFVTLAACAAPPAALASPAASVPSAGVVRGTVVSLDWSELTVQRPGERMSVIGALTHAANLVAAGDYPYVWGGGHVFAGTASTGMRGGPGSNGPRIGFDCSGSVAAVLAGAGLWAPGTGVPGDAGVIAQLRQAHLIARGAGVGPRTVTLWDDRGVHIFIQIGDSFFGTSDGGPPSPANPHGGPAWLDDGAPDTLDRRYRPWHLLPAALRGRVNAGQAITVGLGGGLAATVEQLAVGDRVGVRYATRRRALVAVTVDALGGSPIPVQ
jgi:hypothetical protein